MRAQRVAIPKHHLEEDPNGLHWTGFRRSLRAARRSEDTITAYHRDLADLAWFHAGKDLADLKKIDIQEYFSARLERLAATTMAIRFRSQRAFYNWMVEEDIIQASPMKGMKEPAVDDVPPPIVEDSDLKALLKVCSGTSFEERRDHAVIRLFCEAGSPRVGEMAGIRLEDVDLRTDEVTVRGKGNKTRKVPLGPKCAQAIERYIRVRAKRPNAAASPMLWLSTLRKEAHDHLTVSGIAQMLERRCGQAGIAKIHPHQLRHTAAHVWMDAEGSEGDAMELFGWSSDAMPKRYGRSAKNSRARRAAKRKTIGDRL
ncbi:tyrosine-type recombinase/integrase [Dactylosporangium roseum]|uniref:Tyrosine-type recombinase/integrase n=1 Tax=Dactylosporangium roseum TaxID=47989 RepID=A0ABY5Z6R0_9ACTN|nr:tyrosine-type recombinase/integrase [Dactylosporangium roseum]UWZ37730.1 tyrosine-type recombinase/integrase [Dactylosporangium roseum]